MVSEEDIEMESPHSECERSGSPAPRTQINVKFLSGEIWEESYPEPGCYRPYRYNVYWYKRYTDISLTGTKNTDKEYL